MSETQVGIASGLFTLILALIVAYVKLRERVARLEEFQRLLEKRFNHRRENG
jgi:hypothetical protein